MGQVLNRVLAKIAGALKRQGGLLITLPTMQKGKIELWVDGAKRFSDFFPEPRFDRILQIDNQALDSCVADQLFTRIRRGVTPFGRDDYYYKCYRSPDDWLEGELRFCADPDALYRFAERMKKAVPANGREGIVEVREHYRDEHQLLAKQG